LIGDTLPRCTNPSCRLLGANATEEEASALERFEAALRTQRVMRGNQTLESLLSGSHQVSETILHDPWWNTDDYGIDALLVRDSLERSRELCPEWLRPRLVRAIAAIDAKFREVTEPDDRGLVGRYIRCGSRPGLVVEAHSDQRTAARYIRRLLGSHC
jgi:hypothetical protein